MKYRTKESAIDNVRLFFSNTPSEDVISLEEAFKAWGRPLEDFEGNMSWFSNKMTHLKYHGLVKPLYALRNKRRVLDKIQLTLEGKRALGRIEGGSEDETPSSNGHSGSISLAELTKLVVRFKNENKQEFDITFDVKLKNG